MTLLQEKENNYKFTLFQDYSQYNAKTDKEILTVYSSINDSYILGSTFFPDRERKISQCINNINSIESILDFCDFLKYFSLEIKKRIKYLLE